MTLIYYYTFPILVETSNALKIGENGLKLIILRKHHQGTVLCDCIERRVDHKYAIPLRPSKRPRKADKPTLFLKAKITKAPYAKT